MNVWGWVGGSADVGMWVWVWTWGCILPKTSFKCYCFQQTSSKRRGGARCALARHVIPPMTEFVGLGSAPKPPKCRTTPCLVGFGSKHWVSCGSPN